MGERGKVSEGEESMGHMGVGEGEGSGRGGLLQCHAPLLPSFLSQKYTQMRQEKTKMYLCS
jgi:hypothetical protein